jgi:hypothetical protein
MNIKKIDKTFRLKGTSNVEKNIAIYEIDGDNKVSFYCEKGEYETTKEIHSEMRKNPLTASHIMVRSDKEKKVGKNQGQILEQQYKTFILDANIVKTLTNGIMNPFKTGGVSKTALQLFFSMNPPKADDITANEARVIQLCKNGGLIWGDKYKGKAYKADVVSQYASIMRSDHFQIPIKEGIFKTITLEVFNELKFFTYGLYHVKVSNSNHKLLVHNENNWYTHIDLNLAIKYKYTLELIEDGEDNHLDYTGKLINGAKLFRSYIDYIFNFKKAGHKQFKWYLQLHGFLSKSNEMDYILDVNHPIGEGVIIKEALPLGGLDEPRRIRVTTMKKERVFDYGYARLKPFVSAKARAQMSNIVFDNIDNVKRVYVDGIITTKRLKNEKFGSEMGEIKYEGKCKNCEILNSRDVKGEFII